MASREIVYNSQQININYSILNNDKKNVIVILHGWGSNKEIMQQAFGKYFKDYKHIYADLPGFGKSTITTSLFTKDYAAIMKLFLNSLHVDVFAIFGHSYGGKVATLLNPKNLILLSSAGIYVKKDFSVKAKIFFFKIFKNILPKNMYKLFASKDVSGMNEIMYQTFKNVVDEDFNEIFKKTLSKTYIFWGKEDTATPLFCGKQISNFIKNSKFYPLDGDHFFFLKQAKKIDKLLEEEL